LSYSAEAVVHFYYYFNIRPNVNTPAESLILLTVFRERDSKTRTPDFCPVLQQCGYSRLHLRIRDFS